MAVAAGRGAGINPYPSRGTRWNVQWLPNHPLSSKIPRVTVEVLDSGHGSVVIVRRDIPGKYPVKVSIVEWERMQAVLVEG